MATVVIELVSTESSMATTTASLEQKLIIISTAQFIILILFALMGFMCIVNNAIVVYIIIKSSKLQKKLVNSLLFNQCLIDIATNLCLILKITIITNISYSGLWGNLICRWWTTPIIVWCFLQASVCNLGISTVERYFTIVHHIFHRNHQSKSLSTL